MWKNFLGFFVSDEAKNFLVLAGVLVAIFSIWTSRLLARRKQAADLLFASRSDTRLQKGADIILDHYTSESKNIVALAKDEHDSCDDAREIRYVLNHFELLSVGIQNKIYDETMIKQSWCSIVCRTYQQVAPYIQERRQVSSKRTIYQEFEWLAKRWEVDPLSVKKPKRFWFF